jgi:hypothetical protein
MAYPRRMTLRRPAVLAFAVLALALGAASAPALGDTPRAADASALPESLPAQASCGDYQCSPPEDCNSCPQDCGSCCGDGRCAPPEDCSSCPDDCGRCGEAPPNRCP